MKSKHLLFVFLCFFLFNRCSTPTQLEKKVLNFDYASYIGRPVGDLLKDLDAPYRRLDGKEDYGLFCGCDLVLETKPTIYLYVGVLNAGLFVAHYRLWDSDDFKEEIIQGIQIRKPWFRKTFGNLPSKHCRSFCTFFD